MRNYLEKGYEKSLTISHAKVIQRSYGREKRFFCPPPFIRFKDCKELDNDVNSKREVCAYIGTQTSICDMHMMDPKENGAHYLEKPIFITSSDKRKYFDLQVKLFYSNGENIGCFSSKCVRVVTKPSKKKFKTSKNHDLCIESGSEIALFNRLRSQTVSTRFVKVFLDLKFFFIYIFF